MSTREGFGLTVAEAMWKGVPVVGRKVGGIPLQIIDGENGYLIDTVDQAAEKTLHLLKNRQLSLQMGAKAREHVRENFLIISQLRDNLNLYSELLKR
jgi:trehalose synthase